METKLFKRNVTYTDKSGEEKKAVNFFIQCGDQLIPVEVKYFENKETGEDNNYRSRKSVLSAFAEELPPVQDKPKQSPKVKVQDKPKQSPKVENAESSDDEPFQF
jgi:hypothetical protein